MRTDGAGEEDEGRRQGEKEQGGGLLQYFELHSHLISGEKV